VRRSGEEVHLTRTEFLLLCELAANSGQGSLAENSCSNVSGATTTSEMDGSVDVHVRRLRTKIENDPSEPRHVLTVRGPRIQARSLAMRVDGVATAQASPEPTALPTNVP